MRDRPETEAELERALVSLLAERRPGKAIDPAEVARAVGGSHPEGWGPLMKAVRRVAVRLAVDGRVVILRKGRPVEPGEFKGVYRIGLPPQETE